MWMVCPRTNPEIDRVGRCLLAQAIRGFDADKQDASKLSLDCNTIEVTTGGVTHILQAVPTDMVFAASDLLVLCREMFEWIRFRTGPADGTHDMLVHAHGVIENAEDYI